MAKKGIRKDGGQEARPNTRSFRYSDTVKNILNEYYEKQEIEKSMNDALNDLVIEAHMKVPEAKAEFKSIQKDIKNAKKRLDSLNQLILKQERLFNSVTQIGSQSESLKNAFERLVNSIEEDINKE